MCGRRSRRGDTDGGEENRCVSRLFLYTYFYRSEGERVEGVVEGGDVDGGNGIKVSNLLSTKVSRFFLFAKVSRFFFFACERQLPLFSQMRGRDRMGGRTGYPVDSRR